MFHNFKGFSYLLIENYYTYLTGLLWGKNNVKECLVSNSMLVYEKLGIILMIKIQISYLDMIWLLLMSSSSFLSLQTACIYWLILNLLQFPEYVMLSLDLRLPSALRRTHPSLGCYHLYNSTSSLRFHFRFLLD